MDCGLEFNPTLGPLQLTIPEDELGVVEALFPLLWWFEDNPEPPPQDNVEVMLVIALPVEILSFPKEKLRTSRSRVSHTNFEVFKSTATHSLSLRAEQHQMASHFGIYTLATPRAAVLPPHKAKQSLLFFIEPLEQAKLSDKSRGRIVQSSRIRVSNGGDSYYDMWKKAVDRERKAITFRKIVENSDGTEDDGGGDGEMEEESPEVLERKSSSAESRKYNFNFKLKPSRKESAAASRKLCNTMSDRSQIVTSPNSKKDLLASALCNDIEIPQMEHPRSQPVENLRMDPHAESVVNPSTAELEGNAFWPLSSKPFFHLLLSKSHVKPSYQLVIPAKFHPVLPCATVPAVLTYLGKSWEVAYIGDRGSYKKFDTNWKTFAIDNDLKVGDACVFELMECSRTNIMFRVQILRGDFPPELLARVNGDTSNTPILID
ncbi:hypothetical protein F0562_014588 [Nyssa sinensis]|uniref:TF-B3 domain-containing protein n=1 Tax=Nyssa sinensis TaxID=561372 RepID=A0A5J4ZSG9_9ASTE|nr:hypothetical protein F0562_014588 [Nyssa sinensis]